MSVQSILFYVSLFLVRLPPLYFFPVIQSSLLTTHSFSRGLIVFLFVRVLWKKEYQQISRAQWSLFILYLLFLLVHSLSAFNAVNQSVFLLRYKDVVFPGLYLLVSFVYIRKLEDLVKVFIYGLIFNFFYQMIMFFIPSLYLFFAKIFVYEGHRDFVNFNLQRGRIFIETYDELVLPLVFAYSHIFGKKWAKLTQFCGLIFVALPTLLSNFRSRLLMLVFAAAGVVVSWTKKLSLLFIGLILFVLIAFISDYLSLHTLGFSLFDRLLFRSAYEDVQSLESRWEGVQQSFALAGYYAPFGIGMGNYYDNLPPIKQSIMFSIVGRYGAVWTASLNPHNIFAQIAAETGVVGLIIYLFIISYFFVSDIRRFSSLRRAGVVPAFIIAFWSLFSYSFFNPSTTLTYNTLFWLLRSAILYESTD